MIKLKECHECAVFFESADKSAGCVGECRLNPPVPVSAWSAAYPIVRANTGACSCGSRLKPAPKKRKVVKKCAQKTTTS